MSRLHFCSASLLFCGCCFTPPSILQLPTLLPYSALQLLLHMPSDTCSCCFIQLQHRCTHRSAVQAKLTAHLTCLPVQVAPAFRDAPGVSQDGGRSFKAKPQPSDTWPGFHPPKQSAAQADLPEVTMVFCGPAQYKVTPPPHE